MLLTDFTNGFDRASGVARKWRESNAAGRCENEGKVGIWSSGVMGDAGTVLANILGGRTRVDVVRISAFALNRYGCTKSTFLTLHYVFTSEEHDWHFISSDLAKDRTSASRSRRCSHTVSAHC